MNKFKNLRRNYLKYRECLAVFTLLLMTTTSLAAKEWFAPNRLELGLKNLTQFVGKIQNDDQGNTESFAVQLKMVGALHWTLYQDLSFSPELGLGFPRKGRDEHIKKYEFYLLLPLSYQVSEFQLNFGPGFYFTHLTSQGGTQTLQNGNSTEEFFLPSGKTTARNLILTTGIDWKFLPEVFVKTQMFVFNAETSQNRAFSYLVGLTYNLNLL